jgi:charged multivesicular body protein 7
MSSKNSVYDTGWLPYRIASFVVGRPLWWALEQVGIVGDEGILTSNSQTKETAWCGDHVFLPLIERAAEAVMSLQAMRATGPADALYTFEGFRRSFGSIFGEGESNQQMTGMDARVLVKYLERERRVLVVDEQVIISVLSTKSTYLLAMI